MLNRFVGLILSLALAVVAVLVFSPALFTQTSAPSGGAKAARPDLSGMWRIPTGPRAKLNSGFSFTFDEPPTTPEGAEKLKAIRSGPKRNQYDRGNENWDPADTHCLPWGPTRAFTKVDQAFEIVPETNVVYILFETNHEVRRIYMDGREHPRGWPFGWMGHSTGKYDGDTLVVDTVGLNDLTWIDTFGHPHSDALHIVERFRRPDHETLQIDFLFDDPKTYTKPWPGKRIFQLQTGPEAEVLEYISCEDHLRYDHVPRFLKGDKEP